MEFWKFEKRVLDQLESEGLTKFELAMLTGLAPTTCRTAVRRLKRMGFAKKVGQRKIGKYRPASTWAVTFEGREARKGATVRAYVRKT